MDRLQTLELFVGTAREGSLSAAGRRAGLSPASVSRHIGELEARLGIQLFHRTTRHLALTDAGKVFLQRVEQVLHGIADAEAAALALQAVPRGTLSVHSRTLFGVKVVTPLLPRFQAAYPELKVELRLSERRIQLRDEEFDVDLLIGTPTDPSLRLRRLLASQRILVASPDYVRSRPAVRQPDDLARHNCLTYWMGAEPVVWKFLNRDGGLGEIAVSSSFTCNNGLILSELAVAGHGVALLDDYTVAEELLAGKLVRLLPSYKVTNSTFDEGVSAAFLPSAYLPEKIRVFIDFMAREVPRLVKRRATRRP
jgi:DNA-binding transcriptional LysR family regulator